MIFFDEKASVAVLGHRGWSPGKTAEEDGVITMANKSVTTVVYWKLEGVIEERLIQSILAIIIMELMKKALIAVEVLLDCKFHGAFPLELQKKML